MKLIVLALAAGGRRRVPERERQRCNQGRPERLPPGSAPREAAPPSQTHKGHPRAPERCARRGPRPRHAPSAPPIITQPRLAACSGHGSCGAFDECACFPNWREADCSGRTCPFAAARVGHAQGDLDGSADALSGTGTTVIAGSSVYPHGTTEQYPYMADSAEPTDKHGPRLRRVRQQGHLRPRLRRVRVLPGLSSGAHCQKATCADPTCCGHGICMNAAPGAAGPRQRL